MIMRLLTIAALWLGLAGASATALPMVQEVTAKNGVTAWFVEDHQLPLLTVKLVFPHSGAAYDPAGKDGLAYFASQLLDEGAGGRDALHYHQWLEDNAVQLGADTGEDVMSASMRVITDHQAVGLAALGIALTAPRFDADAVERVRASLLATLREAQGEPGYLASLHWKQAAFGAHPYHRPRSGTVTSLPTLTRADLRDYVDTNIACARPVIAVVGDTNAATLKQWLEQTFHPGCGKFTPASVPDVRIAGPSGNKNEPVRVALAVPQTVVQASVPAMRRDEPDYYAGYLLNHILGGDTLTSRLGKAIRDQHGLAYYADSALETLDHAGFFSIHFATRTEKAAEAVALFREQLRHVAAEGVSEQELADAKAHLIGAFPLQLDSQGELADYLLAMQRYGLGRDYLAKRNGLLAQVTREQVNQAAKRYFTPAPLIVLVGTQEK